MLLKKNHFRMHKMLPVLEELKNIHVDKVVYSIIHNKVSKYKKIMKAKNTTMQSGVSLPYTLQPCWWSAC